MTAPPKPFSADALLLESVLVPTRRRSVLHDAVCDLDTVMDRVANALPELDAAVKAPEALLSELLSLDRNCRCTRRASVPPRAGFPPVRP